MKYSEKELEKLEIIIENYGNLVKEKKYQSFIDSYNKFLSSFNKLFTTLSSEKILNIDPYGQEYNLEKLEFPESTPINHNEEAYTMSIRLSHYNSLLIYIKTDSILNFNNLDPVLIDKISKLVNFIDWDRLFDPQPVEINTEGLNKVLYYYTKDRGQQYIISVLKVATSDMKQYSTEVSSELEFIKFYLKEKYKLWVRKIVLPYIKLPDQIEGLNIKKAHNMISNKISELEQPLYIELVGEILKEDFSSDGENEKKDILIMLENNGVLVKKEKKIKIEEKPLEILEKAIAEISKISIQTDSIIQKLQINKATYSNEKLLIIEKIIIYIKENVFGSKIDTIYKIKDSKDSKVIEKELNFDKFISSIKVIDKKLTEYKDTESDMYKALLEKGEDDVQVEIHHLLSKCRHIYKNLNSLDSFFKKNINSAKGIKIELKIILSSIEDSQTFYFEYKKKKSESLEKSTYKPDKNLTV